MSTVTNLKLLVRGSLPPDSVFELRAERYPSSEEWDVIFETLTVSRRQSDRKRDAETSGIIPENAPASAATEPSGGQRSGAEGAAEDAGTVPTGMHAAGKDELRVALNSAKAAGISPEAKSSAALATLEDRQPTRD